LENSREKKTQVLKGGGRIKSKMISTNSVWGGGRPDQGVEWGKKIKATLGIEEKTGQSWK